MSRIFAFSRYRTRDSDGLLPPRGDYLRHSAMFLMEQLQTALTVDELASRLNIKSDPLRTDKLARYLTRAANEGKYFSESNGKFSLMPNLLTAWDRTQRMVEYIGQRFFTSNIGNPLQITDGRESRWLTTLDLAFLCLFTLNMLVETCRLNKVLLIGITKDTTCEGHDYASHPIMCRTPHLGRQFRARSDHGSYVTAGNEHYHHDEVQVPWATVEYDTSFQTIIGRFNDVKGDISGAVKNRIIQEQLFVKSYIQLDKSKSDDQFRSNVLFIDRLYLPSENAPTLSLKHEYGGAVEEVEPILWQAASSENHIQELVMITLKAMTHDSIPEIFGHNEPLYIADKIAKAQRSNASQMIRGMGHWLISHPKLRKYSFYMNTFRSRRSEIENARNRT